MKMIANFKCIRMKRNDLRFFFFVFITVLLFNGCVKLNEDLTGQPSTDKFFHDITDYKSFIAGAYTPLFTPDPFTFAGDFAFIPEAGAEDVHTVVKRWKGFEELNVNAVSNPNEVVDPIWNNAYTSISTCNTMISVINSSSLEKSETDPILGEAKFMRALNYFFLVRWFGEIPLLTETNQLHAATEPQLPVADVYTFIVNDLKDAETFLPQVQSDKAKPTSWAAKSLLAKVYLTMAGFPLNQTGMYANAEAKAAEVINANVYSLAPNFADLWDWDNRMSNPEFIFTLYANSNSVGGGSYLHMTTRPWDHGENGWGDWETDSRFLANFPDGPRKDATFYLTMIDGTDWSQTSYGEPYVAKYRDAGPKSNFFKGPPSAFTADGFSPLLRYADVLLIYAEAANQAEGSPSPAAYDAIDKVRSRAGLAALPAGMSQVDFDKAVLDERNWELAFEHNRWFDLCRKHMVKDVMQSWYPNSTIDDHNYLMPKPTDQLFIMKGVKQNPGY